MKTLFISDLHLSADRPDITGLFVDFLRGEARSADALYILGDLVEYWIGDDDSNEFHLLIETELAAVTASGVPVYFIHGNRDFLIGERFAERTGVEILPEPSVIDLYGRRTVILHGDTLCTKDVSYQRFRKVIRHPWLLAVTTRFPLSWRRAIANKLRSSSAGNPSEAAGAGSEEKPGLTAEQLDRYDAQPEAVVQLMQETNTQLMIHGHTHRPAVHEHGVGSSSGSAAGAANGAGNGAGELTRVVLGDWYEQGSILTVTPDDFALEARALD
ncbi:MAG: UDP-2,3-diacylglucosamine diphosphatase [Gammaproteobacteria bacterium]|nr:UDP-2,3-diacylglucosamine diphosphatase [Gammaproteobacteria bacterium]